MSELTASLAWNALQNHSERFANFSLKDAFSDDTERASRLSLSAGGLFYDYSKELIDDDALSALLDLAGQQNVAKAIQAMQSGEELNTTEGRQVLHHLLRQTDKSTIPTQLHPQFDAVINTRAKMKDAVARVHNADVTGVTGKAFTDIVHIGIGGSYLGPEMIYQGMQVHHLPSIRCHFISNICAHELARVLDGLNPETCLFVVASKTFTTLETLTNANTAKHWLEQQLGKNAVGQHFYAVTSSPEKAESYGISPAHIFAFWDWVGGRFSSFSAIGLSLALGLGWETFESLLDGAATMDTHFFDAPLNVNMPVLMALIGVWYVNFFDRESLCIAAYDSRLRSFAPFLQQLEMESNGKSTDLNNNAVDYHTCPTIFGEPGTNCQHSYFQLLHQSPEFVPVNFIACAQQEHTHKEHQDWLFANCLAQANALMLGQQTADQHKHMPGNRPSSTLLLDRLSPENMGALVALYEHKVYVQSVIWNVNAFDQWGVELGKQISKGIKPKLDTGDTHDLDPSTAALLTRYQKINEADDIPRQNTPDIKKRA
ncbi:Glucose-6-phosphate isomerase [BD1-7 clade bacterium]|uniref:Glucose-6-phosphate isomerase n=1 Tax=BD1-7 clade bacterium TaxID=2029982 RepID=A0A5S9PCY4_9GAMM|nr:Glucose-6-phosphate isomerase [BD1-7 clade bacterium]